MFIHGHARLTSFVLQDRNYALNVMSLSSTFLKRAPSRVIATVSAMIELVLYFSWPDYLIFSLTLLSSLLIGIYHAWKGAGSSTTNYLLGGKKMAVFPIAMSLASRYSSSADLRCNQILGKKLQKYLLLVWCLPRPC